MHQLEPGDVFEGRYRIESVLGEGGFAIVYRAFEDVAQRAVAIKVLKPQEGRTAAESQARFEREVGVVAQLRSPHAVRMFDSGRSSDGLLYAVFELVGGRDLSALLADVGRLDADATAHILRQVLHALREAHSVGLLHRDIKPENIRVFEYMADPLRVKLLDFGLARSTDPGGGAQITRAGDLVGTPRYMSPEQLRAGELTPASDIYGLGVVAYEMLMGPEAMHGRSISDQIDRVASSQALALPGSTDAVLRGVIERMVQRDVSQRFRTATEVLRALGDDVTSREHPTIREVPGPHPSEDATTKQFRSTSLLLLLLAGLGAAVVMGAFLSLAVDEDDDQEVSIPPALRDTPPSSHPTRTVVEEPVVDAGTVVDTGAVVSHDAGSQEPDLGSQLSSGCGKEAPFVGREKLEFGGRQVIVALPEGYDSGHAYPALLLYHDTHHTPHMVYMASNAEQLRQDHRAIIIAPRQRASWADLPKPGEGLWTAEDALVAPRILDFVGSKVCLDRRRVYALGLGEGGEVVEALPCALPGLTAAAAVSHRARGTLPCEAVPVPFIQFTGLDDRNLAIDGDGCLGRVMPLADYEALWRKRNSCTEVGQTYESVKGETCQTWSCAAPFVSCRVEGGRGFAGSIPREFFWDPRHCDGPRPKRDLLGEAWRFFESVDSASPPSP